MRLNLYNIFFLFVFITSCKSQNNKIESKVILSSNEIPSQVKNTDSSGIIYFSFDNGNAWRNMSKGLPQNLSIGLGGIAVSENQLGLATKENGVYTFDFKDNVWKNISTAQKILQHNIGALIFFKDAIYLGTQHGGVYYKDDSSKTWQEKNIGLNNKTIRRFEIIDNKIYVCTNDGLYSLSENKKDWKLEYGNNSLQVNGVTKFQNNIYIATNKGVFKHNTYQKKWEEILPDHSLHNISADGKYIYAMTYNELLLISSDGITWSKAQDGLPEGLYTFNILTRDNVTFAGQWDGVYNKSNVDLVWKKSSNGLPSKFAATNLKSFNDLLIISTSHR